MAEITIDVGGMTCDGCSGSITRAIERLEGVTTVAADHTTGRVAITGDTLPDRETLKQAIEDAGYDLLPEGARQLPMA